ncbi:uncharacterized protein EV154DRAFT_50745 [Mucor mucedo]|uniref:uncharacterized protein n=1 Tax=Mucor mucedo TaxID=29922 RepID=UPI00221F36A0|nr:uncharacterized protein EV154DRAFT_50745 [Mucor mucedo]KAI7895067.1 hypothetical protein EV154DRAFT_50745 [Mucor mucedo]
MGVQGLTNILVRYAPSAVREIRANTLSKQTIAFDASCHLNKFIYGEDKGVPHRHIHGFYQLARFCQLNHITPIFVFDGPGRLPAKHLETEKRARSRRKVKHSLLFEQNQSTRLDAWSQLTTALAENSGACYPTVQPDIESKLTVMAKELRQALSNSADSEKYTRTVRELAIREDGLVTDMMLHRIKEAQSCLKTLQRDNLAMTHSLEVVSNHTDNTHRMSRFFKSTRIRMFFHQRS